MSAAEKIQKKYISVEEYFEMEKHSEIRHEYYDGEVFAMAGISLNHNEIIQNIAGILRPIFRPKGCKVLLESVKLEAIKHFYYPYPDLMLTCDAEDMDASSSWLYDVYEDSSDIINFPKLDFTLSLSAIYEGIKMR